MDRKELDDALYALTQTMSYYGKELDENQVRFWRSYLVEQDLTEIKTALLKHSRVSKYAPKIADITEQIELAREMGKTRYRELPAQQVETQCPPEISAAWMFWMKHWHGFNPAEWPTVNHVSAAQAEAWLILVNQEAKRANDPSAIPEKYRVMEIWQ